jgi:hypothetical protein
MSKTWREKMNPGAEPKVVLLTKRFMSVPAGSRMLVATPEIVRDYMVRIPKGQTRTTKEMREELAKAYKAEVTCPTSSGIFVRISSEAALEDLKDGKPLAKITPFWRLVDPDSQTAGKLSCGPDFIRERRKAEAAGAH